MFHLGFSELHNTIEDLITEGDKVAVRTSLQATHTSNFQGLPPTGKRVTIGGITIERIQDGKIVERWVNIDYMGMMQQLGLIPPPTR